MEAIEMTKDIGGKGKIGDARMAKNQPASTQSLPTKATAQQKKRYQGSEQTLGNTYGKDQCTDLKWNKGMQTKKSKGSY